MILKDKVAVVTGSGQGIGEGIAMLLASFLPYYATLVYLLFFGHKEELLKIFTWSLVGGEILCLISFFVLGAQFWEDVKNLFRWKGNNMSTQGGL